MIGSSLSHFRITAKLGEGGMGEVYQAEDTKLGRQVAIKVLPEAVAADPERLARFEREAKVLAALNHPNIAAIYSLESVGSNEAAGLRAGRPDDAPVSFLVMELVDGDDLSERIARGAIPLDEAVPIAIQIAEALEAAHEKGIVHRDLKPANVRITDKGRVKVLDFGLAKDTRPADPDDATVTSAGQTALGVVLGTPAFMSPEQATGRAVDFRTDLFSLGVLLYEMASGQKPFQGQSAAELVSSILRDTPRLPAHVPAAFATLTEGCLAKDPAERPSSAAEIRDQLVALRATPLSSTGGEHAALAALDSPLGNLPVSVDTFVAREEELSELRAFLEGARLVTLVGAGGTGKTRLAVETAAILNTEFPDGTWLAELAPVTKEEAVPHVVADLIGAVQQPGKTITQSVVDSLRHRVLLLVLDNCEHLLDAAADLAKAITTHCQTVRILATSRENLAIRGEQVVRLQSLSDEQGAVLFRERALAAGAPGELDMDTLARLSRRLDGMPLAIELAAARSGSMSPEEIEKRLDDRFRLLRGSRRGRMERHQTLRNTVAWSYDLLEPLERQVFARLSTFAGGFTLEAAQAVTGGDEIEALDVEDAIASLVDQSMVLVSNTEDGMRYRLLETLRQFGEEQLVTAGDAPRIHERHVRFFTDFMRQAWTGLWSAEDPEWIRAIGHEYENLRVAVYAAIDNRDREALATLIKPHMWWAWHELRYEVGDWAEEALAVQPEPAYVRAVANHLFTHGGRPEDATRLAEAAAEPGDMSDQDAVCLWAWGHWNASIITESPELRPWMHRAIEAAQLGEHPAQAAALKSIEVVFRVMAGEMDEARRIGAEALEEARITGNQTALCWSTFMMGRAVSESEPQLALEHFDRTAEIAERIGLALNRGFASTEAAVVIARIEEPSKGRPRLSRALRSFINSGDWRQLWTSAHHFAYFLVRDGRQEDARSIWQELGGRQAWAAQHHRDELTELLGEAGESVLSDEEFVERVRDVLDDLEGAAA